MSFIRVLYTLLAILSTVPLCAQGNGVVLLDEDFQVNTYTTEDQTDPSVAMDGQGRFVVVWESYGSSGSDDDRQSIQGQRFGADGQPIGDEFQVNSSTEYSQDYADVAASPTGDFVVVWVNEAQQTTINGQRYDSSGVPVGDEFEVSDSPIFEFPQVAMRPDGGFLVVWNNSSARAVEGRLFAADGSPVGGEFQIGVKPESNGVRNPRLAADGQGRFVVVWEQEIGGYAHTDIFGQRLTSDGVPLGSSFQVNADTSERQTRPSVAAAEDGRFIVAWEDGPGFGKVRVRQYDNSGAAVANDVLLRQADLPSLGFSSVALDRTGSALAVWNEQVTDSDDINGGFVNASGVRLGEFFQMNSLSDGTQLRPDVALSPVTGEAVVVWRSSTSAGTDQSFTSIQGRRLVLPLFADGFESGNTTAWDVVVAE